jgi:hypothetical protein
MSLNRSKEYIPASIRVSLEESPFWGRLLAISPDRLELMSQFRFKKKKMLALGFELGGETFEEVRGTIGDVLKDPCGYFHYSITLSDSTQQKNILTKLLQAAADN